MSKQAEVALGEGAFVLDESEERAALDAYRKGEAWMPAGETLRLSRHEAGVLAKRYGEEAAQKLELGEAPTRKLVLLFERELNVAFDRTHAVQRGEKPPIAAEIQQAGKRILESSEEFLDVDQRTALELYLKRFASPGGR